MIADNMNMYGRSIQHRQLLEGIFADAATYGDPYPVDWDGSPLMDVAPYHIRGHEAYAWWNDGSTYSPSRIDYIVYSGSVLDLADHFAALSPLKRHGGHESPRRRA